MNVAIIGSKSFLAQYIIPELVAVNINPVLYGKYPSQEFPSLEFTLFQYPEYPIDYSGLLKFDIIIYTSGAGIQANFNEAPEIIYELNSFIPIRLASVLAANNYKGKFVTFGSYFEIGKETNERYYSEIEVVASLNKLPNHYCVSKRLLSRYLSSSPQVLNFYHLILPNMYGKGENSQRLIPYLITALENKREMKLTSGQQVRQYIHVEDIAKTVIDIIQEDYPKGFYNICRNDAVKIKDLVKRIFILSGHANEFIEENLFGLKERQDIAMPYLLLNNDKAACTFKYQPAISIEEGIKTYLV